MSVKIVVPALGESIYEAVVGRWLKNVGDSFDVDEPLVDLETDKINVQVPAPQAGVLLSQKYGSGDTVKVGDVLAEIGADAAKSSSSNKAGDKKAGDDKPDAKTKSAPTTSPAGSSPPPVVHAAAAKAATAKGAAQRDASDSAQGATTEIAYERSDSPAKRKLKREGGDFAPHAAPSTLSQTPGTAAPAPAARPTVLQSSGGEEEIVPLSPLRRTIATRLVQAQKDAAILTTFNEVDMDPILNLRKEFQDEFVARHGIKLGFMSFFVKAVIASLKEFPGLNAEFRDNSIAYKKFYNIGIAVGSGRGLVVPVLRNADDLDFATIEQEISALAKKAQSNALTLDDLSGGTFTITNGGVYGSMMSTPLLNPPQTGILGMHNIVKRPVVIDDQIQIRSMMYLATSYDHRVVDGREAVQFLVGIKKRCENPERMLLSL